MLGLGDEVASCDGFFSTFKEIISENNYLVQQVNETGLFLIKMSFRTYVTESQRY